MFPTYLAVLGGICYLFRLQKLHVLQDDHGMVAEYVGNMTGGDEPS